MRELTEARVALCRASSVAFKPKSEGVLTREHVTEGIFHGTARIHGLIHEKRRAHCRPLVSAHPKHLQGADKSAQNER